MSDEPVAYLGGDQGASGEPPPPPPEEEQVDGYLGGQAEEEDVPSLPPQESRETYSAKDFLEAEQPAEEAPPAEEDPYADPYGAPAATEEPAAGYGDYEGYDAAAVQQTDPAYFDSMAHSGEAAADEAPPAEEYAQDEGYGGDDPDQPKTISQQDAESIIRRITTKRILPPDAGTDKKAPLAPAPKLTEVGGGPRLFPLVAVVTLIVAAMGAFFFGEEIASAFPGLRPYMPWVKQEVTQVVLDAPVKKDPNEEAKKAMLDLVLKSEAKAFGVAVKDVPAPAAPAGPGTGPRPTTGTTPTTTGATTDAKRPGTTTSTGGN